MLKWQTAGAFQWFDAVGYNPDIDTTSTPEDIWAGSSLYTFPAAAAATTIESDSASDATAGTGARTVRVTGLNASWLKTTEDVTLNGVTPVTLTNQFIRILKAECLTVGSGGVNAGNLTVKISSTICAYVMAGFGMSKLGVFSVPADYTMGYLTSYYLALQVGNTGTARFVLQSREFGKSWRYHEIVELDATGTSIWHHEYDAPLDLPPKSDIRCTVLSVGANNTIVSCGMEFALQV